MLTNSAIFQAEKHQLQCCEKFEKISDVAKKGKHYCLTRLLWVWNCWACSTFALYCRAIRQGKGWEFTENTILIWRTFRTLYLNISFSSLFSCNLNLLFSELSEFKGRRIQYFRKNLVDLVELELKHAKVGIYIEFVFVAIVPYREHMS